MNIVDSLMSVASTLVWSLFLTGLSVSMYIMVKYFQGQKEKKTSDKFEQLRNLVVVVPFVWIILNFDSDANTIAETMFEFWLPIVIVTIFTIGLFELVLPVWYDAKSKGSKPKRF